MSVVGLFPYFIICAFILTLVYTVIQSITKNSTTSRTVVLQTKEAEKKRKFTKNEVSLHNSRKDAWIIVRNKVYDVTNYIDEHPGGDSILKNVGGDSTIGFEGLQHPSHVRDTIEMFYIGDLTIDE
eukprot:TRINITY_DN2055_c0_g1_i1.p1 TRINITY_DN2055_c0_g1~~TRINITY_DN2055_c0_g1_i1.p1  ORF type:complete len:126 (+),score=23.30 TRINITY_DN2055_c0_g1_i1:98-475(+)